MANGCGARSRAADQANQYIHYLPYTHTYTTHIQTDKPYCFL